MWVVWWGMVEMKWGVLVFCWFGLGVELFFVDFCEGFVVDVEGCGGVCF